MDQFMGQQAPSLAGLRRILVLIKNDIVAHRECAGIQRPGQVSGLRSSVDADGTKIIPEVCLEQRALDSRQRVPVPGTALFPGAVIGDLLDGRRAGSPPGYRRMTCTDRRSASRSYASSGWLTLSFA